MAKFQPWLKMWVEWIDAPKMLSLSLAEQGAWWRLVTLAKKCDADGALVKGRVPLSLNEIFDAMRIKSKANQTVVNSMIDKMTDYGSLHWNSGALVITHFAERQARIASETPEAIRDRVRRHRERKGVTENPLQKSLPSSPPHPPISKEIEREERRGERNGVTSLHGNGKSVTPEPVIAKISELHEKFFGILTSNLAEKFRYFSENYHGPVSWIDLAFDEAVKYKNRRWEYVEAILYSWQEKGGPHADRREPGGERERLGAGQRDPLATYREAGWEILGEDEPEATEAGNQGR